MLGLTALGSFSGRGAGRAPQRRRLAGPMARPASCRSHQQGGPTRSHTHAPIERAHTRAQVHASVNMLVQIHMDMRLSRHTHMNMDANSSVLVRACSAPQTQTCSHSHSFRVLLAQTPSCMLLCSQTRATAKPQHWSIFGSTPKNFERVSDVRVLDGGKLEQMARGFRAAALLRTDIYRQI